MAKSQSTSKTAVKAAQKPEPGETEKLDSAERILERLSYQCYTLEHINRATEHLRQLAMMLYEAQDGGTKKNRLHDIARGVQDMVDTYADEIDECTEYFNGLVRTAAALHRPKVEGGAE